MQTSARKRSDIISLFLVMIMKKYYLNEVRFGFLLIVMILTGCQSHEDPQSIFIHDIHEGPTPWTFAPAPRSDSSFTFAIIADFIKPTRVGDIGGRVLLLVASMQ